MTLEAQTFANWLGIQSPRVLPGRREESPSFQCSNIPLFHGSHRSHRRYPGVRASARCGRRLQSNFAEQSQFGRVSLDGKSFVRRCLRRIHAGKGRGEQSQFPEWKGMRQDRRQSRPCGDGCHAQAQLERVFPCDEPVPASTDKRVCPWHPSQPPPSCRTPQRRAADCGFRGGGRWRILISLMDTGRRWRGESAGSIAMEWSGHGVAGFWEDAANMADRVEAYIDQNWVVSSKNSSSSCGFPRSALSGRTTRTRGPAPSGSWRSSRALGSRPGLSMSAASRSCGP